MVSKKELFKNLSNYSAEEIAEAVRAGEVSLYELSKNTQGEFTPLLKKKVQYLVENPPLPMEEYQETVQEPEDQISNVEMHTSEPKTTSSYWENEAIQSENLYSYESEAIAHENSSNNQIETGEINMEQNTSSADSIIDNRGMFTRPFSFEGRIRRLEYGISIIICSIFSSLCNALLMNNYTSGVGPVLFFLGIIPITWFQIAQGCKRCHDRGNSGWWQLIPFYGFVMLFGKGEKGENEYGNNPKE